MLRAFFVLLAIILAMPEAFAMNGKKDETRKANRLISAASPYLRQHAYNPIDWYEWSEEAFEKARKENKPVFLSVGYSTCHWCHVMERESFENERIASVLNASFVAIKVDRERRPDVDEIYMLATQFITGQGGWPNSVFMTPDRKPFYSGTYFPPDTFHNVLTQVAGYWMRERDVLLRDAERMAETIQSIMTRRLDFQELTPVALKAMADQLLQEFDPVNGGMSGAPKFPQESVLLFLLRLAEKDGNEQALAAVTHTLNQILNGGITDQVGGGFHRYSVDAQWRVPHFEKMLYNQAYITRALLRGYTLTGNERFAQGARRALDYVLNDLTDSSGGFYSARDADSEGEEGTFYVWTIDQIDEALDAESATFVKKALGVTLKGNFENGTNILHFSRLPDQIAENLDLGPQKFDERVKETMQKLELVRAKREPPHRDEKIVTAWNGMMIATFAEAAETLQDKRYKKAALKAGFFVWRDLRPKGRLRRSWFEGVASLDAQQEDYAFAALGFIALYDLTGDRTWLERAETLIAEMVESFRDEEVGDFFMTASANTFSKAKARTDAGTPSGNAAALEAFAKLAHRTTIPDHRANGEALVSALSGLAATGPHSNAYFLMAADNLLRGGAGSRQYMANGVVDVRAALDTSGKGLSVTLTIADGWHVNSEKPFEKDFIATELVVDGVTDASISYPAPKVRKLGFHNEEMSLYEGKVELDVAFPYTPAFPLTAHLRVQACSDKICLEPETADLRIPFWTGKRD